MYTRIYRDTFAVHQIDHSQDVAILEEPRQADNLEKDAMLLDEIYTTNPRTRLPGGDLQYFMSKDTNPEIRDYIQKQLLTPVTQKPVASQLSDDDMAALTRNHGESRSAYLLRMREFLDSYKDNVQRQAARSVESKTE